MPFIHIQVATGQGVRVADAALAQALTQLASAVLHKKEEVTAVRVERCEPGAWFIGSQPVAHALLSTVHVQIQITEGTNSAEEKARFIAAAFDELSTLLGALHSASYIVVEEIAAEGWGYGGRTQAARRGRATAAIR